MLECHGMDLLSFDGVESHDSDEEEEPNGSRRSLLSIGDEAGWCLFSIDARNTYGLPFEVTFERDQEGASALLYLHLLLLMHSARYTKGFDNRGCPARLNIKVALHVLFEVADINLHYQNCLTRQEILTSR